MGEFGTQDSTAAREMIIFGVRDQEFCIDVMSVRELRAWTPATPVAHAPTFLRGVINLRGVVLPIIDLAIRLGLSPVKPTTRHAILVVDMCNQAVGLLVQDVSEILTIRSEQIQLTPDVASKGAKDYLSGLIAIDKRIISLIAIDALSPPASEQIAA
jgi:purine-binding chemotaxis protein CheW